MAALHKVNEAFYLQEPVHRSATMLAFFLAKSLQYLRELVDVTV